MNRGSGEWPRYILWLDAASMRPRFMNRGSYGGGGDLMRWNDELQ